MFEAVRNNKRVAQVILALLIVPFAFFGMDAYFSDSGSANEAARVGGTTIGAWEFDQALREQQDRLRQDGGGQVDRALLQSAELRRAVLENLINQRVLALYAAENRLVVTPQQLQETIAGVASFQENG
ncbi:MAG TPA: SurA N-terminal domain-containing protein, partial [Thauera aminoaromatica]|nr:SurA N-terminal domain-containing protein [Thauera aminoaromatica]HNV92273.1 SurA N-terminal domain-containing protein [Thauera aminoaromatica]